MSHARLLSVEVERFKSYEKATRLDLKPLTVLVGRNNSGKSTMVQALLLLKQTLENPRTEVPLSLVGTVEALSLRELTYGWPEYIDDFDEGPSFTIVFESRIDIKKALASTIRTSKNVLAEYGVVGLVQKKQPLYAIAKTSISLQFKEEGRRASLVHARVYSHKTDIYDRDFRANVASRLNGHFSVAVDRTRTSLGVEWDHFIPHLTLDRAGLGPRDLDRVRHNLWLFRCQQPLEDLRGLLRGFGFLSSIRALQPTLYRVSASEPPDNVGISGEYAAELLHARRNDAVQYLPPIAVNAGVPAVDPTVRARPLVDAVNDVFAAMGLDDKISIENVKDIGFRLLYGKATLQHVGRGLTYLLPLVEYGLLLDPRRFDASTGDVSREAFLESLTSYSHAALEEPEAHIHPKLQTQLAHWFVALAMCGRNLIVETHSDHLVRRLRGLIARAPQGSPLEQWLRDNVSIVEVSRDAEGRSTLVSSALTPRGEFERWPADFMDVATDEEREIYDAALDKPETTPAPTEASGIQHDVGEEPEDA